MISFLLFFSKIKYFFTVIINLFIKNYKIVLPLLIVLVTFLYINSLQSQRDDAIKAFNDYKTEIKQKKDADDREALKQQLINASKLAEAKKTLDAKEAENKKLSDKLGLTNRELIAKNLKDSYEKPIKTVDLVKSDYINQLRYNSEHPATVPDPTTNPQRLAESLRISDTATLKLIKQYDALEKACQLETSDYNRLREWSDSACQLIQCK